MTQICNITFVCSEADAPGAIDYVRTVVIPALEHEGVEHIRLCRVRSTANEAMSYALELRFPDFRALHLWREQCMHPALARMTEQWGERLMYFDTVLEVMELR